MKSGKRLAIFLLILFGFCFITGLIFSFTYKEAVIKFLKKYLDKHLTTEIEVSQINFSIFKKFPNATVELKGIVAKSGINFSSGDFKKINTDTLLSAKSVFFEFSLTGIIQGDYKLKNIQIDNGQVTLLIDHEGKDNFSVWESGMTENQKALNFSLQNITLTNTRVKYVDLSNKFSFDTYTKKFLFKADFSESNNHLGAKGRLIVNKFIIGKSYEFNQKEVSVDLNMDYTKSCFKFSESILSSGKMNLFFQGEIVKSKNTSLALKFFSKGASIKDVVDFYPGKLAKFRNDYQLSGLVDFKGTIIGTFSNDISPKINIDFNLNNGSIANRLNKKKISNLFIHGDFTNGSKKNLSASSLNIKEFAATQENSTFNGALKVRGFDQSAIELVIKSEIDAANFFKFLNIDTLEQVSGKISADIFIKGRITSFKKLNKNEIVSLYKEGSVELKDFSFKFKGSNLLFNHTNGQIVIADVVKLRNVSFKVFDNDFRVECNLSNLTEFLFYNDFLYAEANLKSDYLDVKDLIEKSKTDNLQKPLDFPKRIFLKSNFTVGRFDYGKFKAQHIVGYVAYKPKIFDFEQFQLEAVEGSISGSATVTQNSENQISIKCFSTLDKLNIQKLFYAMNNFGQNVILEKNLNGELSGSLDFTSDWDENLILIENSVLANSNFEIKNGELMNYEPMLGLSKYIDVDELKNIRFSTLKNQIFIKDKVITIPEMEISSTAFHIKGFGLHRFDNSYDYRIQVELSELLARRARKKRKEIEEFGIVEDDGLGKLNIPIKIIGKGNNYDVNLDKRKAIGTFKKNILDQKDELKNIFNTEKTNDNNQKLPASQNNKLIIDWDDSNEKKDFIFEKNETKKDNQLQFIIEWDDDENAENQDTTSIRMN